MESGDPIGICITLRLYDTIKRYTVTIIKIGVIENWGYDDEKKVSETDGEQSIFS